MYFGKIQVKNKGKRKIRVIINKTYDVKLNKKAPELGAFNITLMFAFL